MHNSGLSEAQDKSSAMKTVRHGTEYDLDGEADGRSDGPAGMVITENAATMADTTDPNLANNMATVNVKVQ